MHKRTKQRLFDKIWDSVTNQGIKNEAKYFSDDGECRCAIGFLMPSLDKAKQIVGLSKRYWGYINNCNVDNLEKDLFVELILTPNRIKVPKSSSEITTIQEFLQDIQTIHDSCDKRLKDFMYRMWCLAQDHDIKVKCGYDPYSGYKQFCSKEALEYEASLGHPD